MVEVVWRLFHCRCGALLSADRREGGLRGTDGWIRCEVCVTHAAVRELALEVGLTEDEAEGLAVRAVAWIEKKEPEGART